MYNPYLTYRESSVFYSLLKNFVRTATPVSSKFLATDVKDSISSATIRNVLTQLEKKGLVVQPHTSAGRIPTDLGYRYYVNDLMKFEKLTLIEKQKIDSDLKKISNEDVEIILDKACNVLSEISNQLGVVLSPKFYQGRFEKIELVKLTENKLLIIISVSSGMIKKIRMEFNFKIKINKIEETKRILNERLSGLKLWEIKESIQNRMKDVALGDKNLIDRFTSRADEIFDIDNDTVYFKGTSYILTQPEFANTESLKKILKLIDNQRILVHLIKNSTQKTEKISITIGDEHREELVKNCSLISTTYKIGSISGTLGIIGPTRMKYEKLTSLVDYIARGINNLFS